MRRPPLIRPFTSDTSTQYRYSVITPFPPSPIHITSSSSSPSPYLQHVRGAMRSCDELISVLRRYTSRPAEKEEAMAALAQLPMTPKAWRTAVGALPSLVELLQQPSGSEALRERGSQVLEKIANYQHLKNGDQVEEVTADLMASIVQLLSHSADWAQMTAACALRELASRPSNQAMLIAAGAVGQLVPLLQSPIAMVHVNAAAALAFISKNTVEGARCIAAAGAVPPLVWLLSYGSAEAVRLSSVAVLANICSSFPNGPSVLRAAGVAAPLLALLKSPLAALVHGPAVHLIGRLACDKDNMVMLLAPLPRCCREPSPRRCKRLQW